MEKSEIAYLLSKGFSISEIQVLEKPVENLVKGDDAEKSVQVDNGAKTEDVEKAPAKAEKKTDGIESLKEEIASLKQMIVDNNHHKVDNPNPAADASLDADTALADLMKQL